MTTSTSDTDSTRDTDPTSDTDPTRDRGGRGRLVSQAPGEPGPDDAEGPEWLRATLSVQPLGDDRFSAPAPAAGRRLFGGQVLAQGVLAASATVDPGRPIHSLHAYFVRGGSPGDELVLEVGRTRDGGSFSTRHVTAVQRGLPILEMMASFQREEQGGDWQFQPPPDVPAPTACAPLPLPWPGGSAFDVRPTTGPATEPVPHPRHPYWIRLRASGAEEGPDLAAAMLVYLSDIALMGVARSPSAVTDFATAASLDHAVWFHRPARLRQWLLYAADPVVNRGARGLARGSLLTREGVLVASVAQEALLRVAGGSSPTPAPA